jgi:V/A-type H+-transporting ATPase subunit B
MNHAASALQRRWAAELYAAYARAKKAQMLASIVGEAEMGEEERRYLAFGEAFERRFVAQGREEARSLERTMEIGWELLRALPPETLTRLRPEEIERYLG